MKILLLSFYYPPEVAPGAFRTAALVNSLLRQVDAHSSIEVITAMPNRFSTYKCCANEYEEYPQVKIHRIYLPHHKTGMIDQSFAFLEYARKVLLKVKKKKYALIIATSARLMTGALGAYISRKNNIPLYLDIRDIFTDTIKDVMINKGALYFKYFFSMIEHYTITSAVKVNLVSKGFRSYFTSRYPNQSYSYFTNGIDNEFLDAISVKDVVKSSSRKQGLVNDVLIVLYAGNFGEGQGLHLIIPELANQLYGKVKFRLIGDGGRRVLLEKSLYSARCRNVEILPPIPRDQLILEYERADVLFMHLNKYNAFEKVLPSKLFEYGSMGKPIWAGVRGYAAEFLKAEMDNVTIFRSCDVSDAISSFQTLNLSCNARERFIKKYSRTTIMDLMATEILSITMQSNDYK